jgi:two-component system KDP operon response regulator KdpE
VTDPSGAVASGAALSPTVLIVEDYALAAEAIQLLLESRGYRVRTAGTVRSAVDACAAEPMDLMLLDLTLPDGDGLRVLDGAAERGALPRTTVVLTGHDDPAVVARCLAAGCLDVLLKPVAARDLLAGAARWLA